MKKNLKILIPTLVLVLLVQVLLVRFFVQRSNTEAQKQSGPVDMSLPYPSEKYDAKEVLQVVLYALRYNDTPSADSGAKASWQFFTPRLKSYLRDKSLIRPYLSEDLWKAVTNFDSHRITYSKINESDAVFELELLSAKMLTRQMIISLTKENGVWLIDQMVKRLQ
jgi:hypothetical protein